MGKADFGSAKYQAKQLKASGLQKLRFYCQLCSKQCRDANGFKMHLSSPSHTGRVSNMSEDGSASAVLERFSNQFEGDFLRLLRVNHGTKKISANKFYQEYILNDKDHVHMNATRWASLTAFVKHLGRAGKVRVELPPDEDDEFNLFIRLVDAAEPGGDKREKNLQTEEERQARFLDSQIEKGKQLSSQASVENASKPHENEPVSKGPVTILLKGIGARKAPKKPVFAASSDDDDDDDDNNE